MDATPEEADKLKLLGYKEETPEEESGRLRDDAKSDYYSSTEQQIYTAAEGLGRGASLGLTDYVFGDDQTKARAKYNPGIATTTEILGAVGVEFVPGLNAIAPAAAVGRGARAVVKGGGMVRGAARGAMEGAIFGGAQAADHAFLSGDPVTAEAVAHGMKLGTLFGLGLGAVAGGLSSRGASNITKGIAQEAEGALAAKVAGQGDDIAVREAALNSEYAAVRQAEARARAGNSFESVPGAFNKVAEHPYSAFKAETAAMTKQIRQATETVEAVLSGNKRAMAEAGFTGAMDVKAMAQGKHVIDSAFRKFSKSLGKTGFTDEKLTKAFETYKAQVAQFSNKAGVGAGSSSHEALMNYAEMKIVSSQIAKMPHTAEGFARMSAERAEVLFAAMDKAKKLTNFPNMSQTLDGAAAKLQESLGLEATGVTGLRSTWKQAKQMLKAESTAKSYSNFKQLRADLDVRQADLAVEKAARGPVAKTEPAEPTFLRKAVAWGAGAAAYKGVAMTGHPLAALSVGARVRNKVMNWGAKTPELLAARQQTLGRIRQAVGGMQTRAGKVMAPMAKTGEVLALTLDGRADTSSTDPKELAYSRLQEMARLSTHVKDTAFRAIEPIAMEQPQLAPALHKYMVDSFQALRGMMPADPGVVSGLKSIWRPSALQAAVMSKQISVWQDPVSSAEEMLATNIFDPIKVKAMKEIAPATYNFMRGELISRLDEPGFMDSMTYRDQVALGTLLDIPINSSMKPEYIAASQQLHTQRNQPLPSPAIPGSTSGGRPASDTPGATAAQISTSR